MKKFPLLLSYLLSGNTARNKPLTYFLVVFILFVSGLSGTAQVTITRPAIGISTSMCREWAIFDGVDTPRTYRMNGIEFRERVKSDFRRGSDTIVVVPPPGWHFDTTCAFCATLTALPQLGYNNIATTLIPSDVIFHPVTRRYVYWDSLVVVVGVSDTTYIDFLQINALGVWVDSKFTPPGNITVSRVVGINGLVPGDTLAFMGSRPGGISGPTTPVCSGRPLTFIDSPYIYPGGGIDGRWISSAPAVATVGSATGIVTGVSGGTTMLTFSDRGTAGRCRAYFPVTILPGPDTLTPRVRDMCAWGDTFTVRVRLGSLPGIWSSTGVTVIPWPGPAGFSTVLVTSHAPGTATISYTVPTGCSSTATLTVHPLPTPIAGPDSVCVGSSIVLSSSPPGGVWTSLSTGIATIGSSAGDVYGLSPGTTRIRYTLPTGCKIDTVIRVNPLPGPILGDTTLCIGEISTLSCSPPGGRWGSSSPSIATINATTGVITAIAFGSTTITYTLPTGCIRTAVITVNPLPGAIAGTSVMCAGDCVTLSASPLGGTWSSGAIAIATAGSSSGIVCGVSGGTAMITYALATGCSSFYTVTVNPLPLPIIGPDSVCVGSVIVMTTGTVGGTWISSAPGIAYCDPVGFVTGILPGTATISYTLPTGCFTIKTVTVNPLPDAITGIGTMCVGDTRTLSSLTSGGTWYSSNVFIATVSTGIVTGVRAGTANISYVLSTGCSTPLFTVTVYPRPDTIRGPLLVCQGQTATYTNTVAGGKWSVDNPLTATIDSVTGILTASTTSTGTVIITYTVGSSCYELLSVAVSLLQPTSGPDSVCMGQTVLFSNVSGGTWSSSDTTIATVVATSGTSATVTGVLGGTATITYRMPSGCEAYKIIRVDSLYPITGTDSVCEGSSITLSNIVTGGLWISQDMSIATVTAGSGIVYGVSAGSTNISYLLPTGCVTTYLVKVNTLPDTIVGIAPLYCEGGSFNLSNATPNGIWTSSDSTNITIDSFNTASTSWLRSVDSGSAVIYYTLGNGCFVSDTLTIQPFSPILGPDSVCVFSSIALYDSTAGGVWGTADTTISVGMTGIITGLYAGIGRVSYSLPSGCVALKDITVLPLPQPIIKLDTALCQYSSMTLIDSVSGGTWTSSDTSVALVDTNTGSVFGVNPGTATITYTLPTGCYITTTLLVNPVPSPILGSLDICLGFGTTLSNATIGGLWSSLNDTIATIDTFTGVVTSVAPGDAIISYTLITTGCAAVDTVTVHAPPDLTITHPTLRCKGDTALLIVNGAGIGGTYIWSPAYGLSCTTCVSAIANPTITTTYTVIGTDFPWGCRDTITTTVIIDSLLNDLAISGRDSICIGTCDTLRATGREGTPFAWKPAIGLSCTVCDTVVACPTATTTYIATAIDDFGCRDSVSFTVYVDSLPKMFVTPYPTIVCRGTPLQIFAFGAYLYVWEPKGFLSCDSCSNPVSTDTANIVYNVTGYTRLGCHDSISVKVSVLDSNRNTISNDTDICIGESIRLLATSNSLVGNLDLPSFLWVPATGLDNPYISNPTATPGATTTYSVIITANVCFKDTLSVEVRVQPLPIIDLQPKSQLYIAGTEVQLTATVTNVVVRSYAWTPANTLDCDTCYNPKATPNGPTKYTVVVTSEYGCVSSDTVSFNTFCDKSQVFIPNTFTPNGDGMNDRFYISGKGLREITHFAVYNRWGQLIFEKNRIQQNDPAAGWDGTFNGIVVQPDVFVYVVDAICELGEKFHYQGDVSLVK